MLSLSFPFFSLLLFDTVECRTEGHMMIGADVEEELDDVRGCTSESENAIPLFLDVAVISELACLSPAYLTRRRVGKWRLIELR